MSEKIIKMVKALADHIVKECEKEGLTIGEVNFIFDNLKFAFDEIIRKLIHDVKLNDIKNILESQEFVPEGNITKNMNVITKKITLNINNEEKIILEDK